MKKSNKVLYVVAIVIVIVVVIALALAIADVYDIPSRFGMPRIMLELNPWVELIIGAFVSILAAFIAAYATIKSVSMSIKNQEEIRREDNRKDVLPMIKIDYSAKLKTASSKELYVKQKIDGPLNQYESHQDRRSINIPIRNVGLREMYNVRVLFEGSDDFCESEEEQNLAPILYKDDLVYMLIGIITYLPKNVNVELMNDYYPTTKMFFNILFSDCFGNAYKQRFSVDVSYGCLRVSGGKHNELCKDFEDVYLAGFEILSAPILICDKKT